MLACKRFQGACIEKRRMIMKKICFGLVALLLAGSAAFAGSTTQRWTPGWDNFNEPLNYKKSSVKWSVKETKLTATFTLVGATPNKLYQVGLIIYCETFPPTFGQFPSDDLSGENCASETRQGVTKTLAGVYVGVVTTDINGDGSFTVAVGPIAAGTYDVSFVAQNGAGCFLIGGAGNGSDCEGDFQSPGPTYGDATTITIP
jgi:hypothetical protein